jgi:hypothetical protein
MGPLLWSFIGSLIRRSDDVSLGCVVSLYRINRLVVLLLVVVELDLGGA